MLSKFKKLSPCAFPTFQGIRILQMPIVHGELLSWPTTIRNFNLAGYFDILRLCAETKPEHKGKVVYLTIDEKIVESGQTHRRPRLHVDGWGITEKGSSGGVWGGGGGTWGGKGKGALGGTGLLTAASVIGCRAWEGEFFKEPAPEGDCEHLRDQCLEKDAHILEANTLYWLSPLCVHESIPQGNSTPRQFMRLSLPSEAEWYEGCTENPLGVKPTGCIADRRRFLEAA